MPYYSGELKGQLTRSDLKKKWIELNEGKMPPTSWTRKKFIEKLGNNVNKELTNFVEFIPVPAETTHDLVEPIADPEPLVLDEPEPKPPVVVKKEIKKKGRPKKVKNQN